MLHILWIYMLHTFTAFDQVTLQVSSLLKISITSWTAESLEECIDIVYVTNMTIISYQLNILLILFDASSCKFPNHCTVNKVDVVYENIDTHYIFDRWNIIHANSLKFWRVRICTVNKKEIEWLLMFLPRVSHFHVSESKCSEETKIVLVCFFGVSFVSKAFDWRISEKRFGQNRILATHRYIYQKSSKFCQVC